MGRIIVNAHLFVNDIHVAQNLQYAEPNTFYWISATDRPITRVNFL